MLFLPSSNRIKLFDLGNTIRPGDREAHLKDFNVQSVCYRAPEILLGQGPLKRVMDIWSAGVIAVELLLDGEVVGEGLPGVELVRSHREDREGIVRRVIELVGSVMGYRGGIYYLDVYGKASLEPVPFPRGGGRRKTPGRWYVPMTAGPEENKGVLRSSLTEKTGEAGIVGFLMEMMEVDVHKRKTVKELMRHPWLREKLLGDWGGVLAHTADGDDGRSSEESDGDGLGEMDEGSDARRLADSLEDELSMPDTHPPRQIARKMAPAKNSRQEEEDKMSADELSYE